MRIYSESSVRVIKIEKLPIYGMVVTVENSDKSVTVTQYTKYMYLDWVAVKMGDKVTPGQIIGTIPEGKMSPGLYDEEDEVS